MKKKSWIPPPTWICTRSKHGLFWAETYPPSKFHRNLLASLMFNPADRSTNQQTNGRGQKHNLLDPTSRPSCVQPLLVSSRITSVFSCVWRAFLLFVCVVCICSMFTCLVALCVFVARLSFYFPMLRTSFHIEQNVYFQFACVFLSRSVLSYLGHCTHLKLRTELCRPRFSP